MDAKRVRDKYLRQLRYAEWKRRQLIKELHRLLDELEGCPVVRQRYTKGPIGLLERVIEKLLNVIEEGYVRRHWEAQKEKKRKKR